MSAELLPHVLKAFMDFYRECKDTLATYKKWEWVKKGGSWNAQKRVEAGEGNQKQGLIPVHFTVFGMVDRVQNGVIVLKRPEWKTMRISERRLRLEFDMQLLTIAQAVEHHGWDSDTIRDELSLASHREVPEGALLFATVLFDVRQLDRGLSIPYVLSVVQFEGMYRGVKSED
ncbi:hypothetical protein R3P38DRAFT_3237453 [Favolaschia claudopus]|uniref:Uncharacterized protein n=1 Tax=Favolaschia claudopus TaxID=2862362 RepID=A0AAV9ZBY6_9AGAR